METGTLTPRSNNIVRAMRFSGGFGQPDGFGSVLVADVRKSGDACLTLTYRMPTGNQEERTWSVILTSTQRHALAALLGDYEPALFETIEENQNAISK